MRSIPPVRNVTLIKGYHRGDGRTNIKIEWQKDNCARVKTLGASLKTFYFYFLRKQGDAFMILCKEQRV